MQRPSRIHLRVFLAVLVSCIASACHRQLALTSSASAAAASASSGNDDFTLVCGELGSTDYRHCHSRAAPLKIPPMTKSDLPMIRAVGRAYYVSYAWLCHGTGRMLFHMSFTDRSSPEIFFHLIEGSAAGSDTQKIVRFPKNDQYELRVWGTTRDSVDPRCRFEITNALVVANREPLAAYAAYVVDSLTDFQSLRDVAASVVEGSTLAALIDGVLVNLKRQRERLDLDIAATEPDSSELTALQAQRTKLSLAIGDEGCEAGADPCGLTLAKRIVSTDCHDQAAPSDACRDALSLVTAKFDDLLAARRSERDALIDFLEKEVARLQSLDQRLADQTATILTTLRH
jgi:hypothetical protein